MENSKYKNIKVNYKVWLENETGSGILGDGKWKLFKAIEKEGSLMAATESLGISYRTTWNNLKKIEKLLGVPLLKKTRGGKEGGNTVLTDEGKKLMKAFDAFHAEFDVLIQNSISNLMNNLSKLQ